MKVDMSPEAVTGRMQMLDQLWELSIALKTSEIIMDKKDNLDECENDRRDIDDNTSH